MRIQIGERDGWRCSYCGRHLVPLDRKNELCTWVPEEESWDHCGCGQHDLVTEPCVWGGYWLLPDGFDWPQVDHVVPQAAGGTDDLSNLVLACGSCNSRKGSMSAERFRLRLELA